MNAGKARIKSKEEAKEELRSEADFTDAAGNANPVDDSIAETVWLTKQFKEDLKKAEDENQ